MKAVNITEQGIIEWYGNKAGYVKGQSAYVDSMFERDELIGYLNEQSFKTHVQDGIYDRLIHSLPPETADFRRCRIYQIRPEADVRLKFIGTEELEKRDLGNPEPKNYHVVYDGNPGTEDLDEIYMKFNMDEKPGEYKGHSLSMSDVIELYDDEKSEFYYVDRFGFTEIPFKNETEDIAVKPEKQQEEPDRQETAEKETDDEQETVVFKFTM
ncbi:MAG: YodL domain-containing protein [Clostridia bacterium]|nr:YodL domain-containing protein [Clostridia bacterium]